MKLTQQPNLRVEDFAPDQSWLAKLFTQLNPFIADVNQVLDQNVDYTTNIKSVTRPYTIQQFVPFTFQWPYQNYPPIQVFVTQASKGTSQTPTCLLLAWSYNLSSSVISVSSMSEVIGGAVSGLSGQYQFTVRATV